VSECELLLADESFAPEVGASFELARLVSREVRDVVSRGALPMVLAGNCNTALGTVSGARTALGDGDPSAGSLGVIWFDAHGDFNTPESTVGGFFDGMALAVLTGRCWRSLTGTIPGFGALPERCALLVGARDLDAGERALLRESEIALVSPDAIAESLEANLDRLRAQVRDVYLHLDLDVLDPAEGRANGFAADGGLTLTELLATLDCIAERFRIRAVALTAYDPVADADGRAGAAALRVLEHVAMLVARADVSVLETE
jgi:arginase